MREPVVAFGSHVFDPNSGVLRLGAEQRPLQSQPAQLLVLLIDHCGQLVTREHIREQLWPDTTVAYDQNINFAIRQIRIALGPDARMVQTVPRKGYRFVGEVTPVANARLRRNRRVFAVAAAMLVGLASGFSAGIVSRDAPLGRFVYDHLVHPDRCPYIQVFLPAHRNS